MSRSPFHLFVSVVALAMSLPVPGLAQAQQPAIYRCADAKGMSAYQNMPCDPKQRTLSVRAYDAKPEDPALTARTTAIQQEMDRRNRPSGRTSVASASPARRTTGPTPCQTAKAKRDATLKRVGLKRTYDLLSRLDSEVWEACKGL